MATANRNADASLEATLYEQPYRFEFHQAVKLLEMLQPHASPFGETENPHDEPLIVKSRIFFDNLASDIYSLDAAGAIAYRQSPQLAHWDNSPPQMQINFMGIAGLPGPLPYVYAEIIHQRERSGDPSLRDFLDIFNHRLVSLLHRLRKQYIVGLSPLTPDKTPHAIAFRSLLGLEQKYTRNRLTAPDRGFFNFAALFWQKPHSAQALSQILELYFQFPARIEQCVGEWRHVEDIDLTRIGRRKGAWNRLGQGAMLGNKIWNQQSKIRLHLGPLDQTQFNSILPGTPGYQVLTELVELYLGPEFDYDINYVLYQSEIEVSSFQSGSGLGWNTWLSDTYLKQNPQHIVKKTIKLTDNQVLIDPRMVDRLKPQALEEQQSLLYKNLLAAGSVRTEKKNRTL